MGGVAPFLANLVSSKLNLKNHWAVADYLQRSARHLASDTDLQHAQAVGKFAVRYAMQGMNGVMPVIKRLQDNPYRWSITSAPLSKIANVEKKLPKSFISKDGFNITSKGMTYLRPLIRGEAKSIYVNGLPKLLEPKLVLAKKQLT